MITEMRLQAARPVADPRLFPRGLLLHLRHGEVIERYVLPVAVGAPETAGAQDARERAERRKVLLVVPLVELGLELGRDAHRVHQEPAGIAGRELVAGQDLIVLEAHQAGDLACDALRPRRQVLAADRKIRRPLQDGDRVQRIGNINALRRAVTLLVASVTLT